MRPNERSTSRAQASELTARGIRLANQGRLQEAIDVFSGAAEIEPEDGLLRYNLGLARANSGQQDRALSEFRLAVRYEPEYADAYFALATSYLVTGAILEAGVCYKACLDFRPQRALTERSRSRIRDIGTQLRSSHWAEWLETARSTYFRGRKAGMKAGVDLAYRAALEKQQTNQEFLDSAEALSKWMMEDWESSSRQWADVHVRASIKLFERRKYYAAIAQIMEAINCYPLSEDLLIMLSSVCGQAREFAAAVHVSELVDRDQLSPDQLATLGEVLNALREGGHLR